VKVLVITNLFPNRCEPNRATFNFQQISELSQICELEVIAPISWLVKLNNLFKYKKYFHYSLDESGVKAYHPCYFYVPGFFRCFQGIFYFLSIFLRSVRCILNARPNVVLGTWAYPDGFAVILLGRIFNLPVVIKVHGTDVHSVETRCKRNLTGWVLRRADRIVSVSDSLANIMQQEFNVSRENIVKIQNGIDKEKFYPVAKEQALLSLGIPVADAKNIIFIGNLKSEKRPFDLLKAFNGVIKDQSQKVCLHFIGDGPLRTSLLQQIEADRLDDVVIVHGAINHEDIPVWLNAADLLVLPSINEGMPNVVLEALSCHTPVVASNVGGIPEIVDEGLTGYLFEPKNVKQLKEKIIKALNKQWLDDEFSQVTKDNTWSHTAKKLYNVLDEVGAKN
jgi:glycosyltransferase involved in cell wall biosynthesis